ncbi:hypothetical protein [Pediococcus acidilactici]|uniref:hypothetical protein n=1 Tax=Pediococcus acidilactici TaxID=1254 RepID=UPI001F4693E0|nr:hypothetical protein [Pediococcus acidilactici]
MQFAKAKNHQNIADKLWLVREKYVSLLTDLNRLSINDITNERDTLMHETHEIYISASKTDSKVDCKINPNAVRTKKISFL